MCIKNSKSFEWFNQYVLCHVLMFCWIFMYRVVITIVILWYHQYQYSLWLSFYWCHENSSPNHKLRLLIVIQPKFDILSVCDILPFCCVGMPGAPGGWMAAPTQVPANCPKGLEYLAQVDQLLIKQKVEALEGNIKWK